MDIKREFLQIARQHIQRDGINNLLNWLESTDFFTAPASSRYHGAFEGGLAMHSLNVYRRLKDLTVFYGCEEGSAEDISMESVAIVALFHDLCKVDYYTVSTRNVKNEKTGQWEKVPFYKKQEQFPFGGHGSKSVYLVQHFMPLEPHEAAAINCHMGSWDRQDYGNPGEVFGCNRLAWLLHVADEAATYIDKT